MKKFTNIFLALFSGLLLWGAWPSSPFTYIVFFAWVPLLWLGTHVKRTRRFFALAYLTLFTWNVCTTWWILNASVPGALGAFFANSLLMCLPWIGYHIANKYWGETKALVTLVAFWMAFEYVHLLDWGLSWPWLTLGNVFASQPKWIQWYEYTGTSGGTLWILAINILLYRQLKNIVYRDNVRSYRHVIAAIVILIVPLATSLIMHKNVGDLQERSNIVVVQPNIDPYEKISFTNFDAQINTLISLSESKIDNNTALVVWPETALFTPSYINEDEMLDDTSLVPVWNFLRRNQQVSLFTGIESYRTFNHKASKWSKKLEGIEGYYVETYNSSVLLDSSGPIQFYHKSMLVPGVETLPWFLRFIDKWFAKFGGTTAGYAKQPERTVLTEKQNRYKIAPAICYESIYGEFMAKYVRNGANMIAIVTNDGWWGNTPGYKQHMNYARLRAIETRRWVARSANTGISCFIDQYGNVHEAQPWDKAAAIKFAVPGNDYKTLYVKAGDILSKIVLVLAVVILVLLITARIKKKRNHGVPLSK